VTVIVVEPEGTVVGFATTVESALVTTGGAKSTVGCAVRVTVSVVSTAVYVTVSPVASLSLALNVATPWLFDTFDPVVSGEMVECVPVPVRATVFPVTGTLPVPKRVTVTIETSFPLAVLVDGAATTVDKVGDGVVAAAGGDPSPAGVPLSVALVSMKNGCDQKWGWVKSFWLYPM
jgi:hypothetical protein